MGASPSTWARSRSPSRLGREGKQAQLLGVLSHVHRNWEGKEREARPSTVSVVFIGIGKEREARPSTQYSSSFPSEMVRKGKQRKQVQVLRVGAVMVQSHPLKKTRPVPSRPVPRDKRDGTGLIRLIITYVIA